MGEIDSLLTEYGMGIDKARTKVLVIDDDDLNLSIMANALREDGYKFTLEANTVKEGLKIVDDEKPALVIVNVAMPEAKGSQIVGDVGQISPDSSVVVMTVYGGEEEAAAALRQGADDFLIKPVQPWEAVSTTNEVIDRANLRHWNRLLTEQLRQRNTELEAANNRLRELDTWKQSLSSMLVHDMKNPLGVVEGALTLLSMTLQVGEDERELLESASISAQRALKLINAILDVQRLEEGKMPLELAELDPLPVIRNSIEGMMPLLAVHRLEGGIEADDDLPPAHADKVVFTRVVENLMDNAIKFTPPGGQVSVSVAVHDAEEGMLVFGVSDTGPGISRADQQRIFEKFAQATARAEGKRSGVGLGLTFCKLAVEAHGGRIWVESEEGEGTTFYFTLPIYAG